MPATELLSLIAKLTVGAPLRVERRAAKREYPKLVSSSGRLTAPPKVQPTEMADRVLLDPVRFEELRRIANNDIELHAQVLGRVVRRHRVGVSRVGSSVDSGETQIAREALHKVDGSAANLGASAIAQADARMKVYLSDLSNPAALKALAEIFDGLRAHKIRDDSSIGTLLDKNRHRLSPARAHRRRAKSA